MLLTLLDIGGTNVRLAFKLFNEFSSDDFVVDYSFDYYFKEKLFNIKDFFSFLEHHFFLFKKVLEHKNIENINETIDGFNFKLDFNSVFDSVLLVSFAGVTFNKKDFKLSNYDFVLKNDFLVKFKNFFVFNDLESVAFRIKRLNEKYSFTSFDFKRSFFDDNTFIEFYSVHTGIDDADSDDIISYKDNFFIVKPGTGLGSSLIFKNTIVPLELSNVPYNVFFEEDKDFYEYLKLKLNKAFVSFEDFVSSKSLKYFYSFINNIDNINFDFDTFDSKIVTFEYENDFKKKETIVFFVKRLLFFSFVFSKSLNSNNIVLSGNIVKSIVKEFFKDYVKDLFLFLQNFFGEKNVFIILEKDQNLKGLLDFYFFYRKKT